MVHYYVYYRADAASLPRVARAAAALLDAIERSTGVRGRWMRRRDDPATCMEVYEDIVDETAFEAALAELTRSWSPLGLERHIERFVDASIAPTACG